MGNNHAHQQSIALRTPYIIDTLLFRSFRKNDHHGNSRLSSRLVRRRERPRATILDVGEDEQTANRAGRWRTSHLQTSPQMVQSRPSHCSQSCQKKKDNVKCKRALRPSPSHVNTLRIYMQNRSAAQGKMSNVIIFTLALKWYCSGSLSLFYELIQMCRQPMLYNP